VGKALLRFILNYKRLTNNVVRHAYKFLKESNSQESNKRVVGLSPRAALNEHHRVSYSLPVGNGEKRETVTTENT